MIYTNIHRNCVVFLLHRQLTRSAIYGSPIFDSHKWPTVLVCKVKRKPHNFEANMCGSLYSTFKTSLKHLSKTNSLKQTGPYFMALSYCRILCPKCHATYTPFVWYLACLSSARKLLSSIFCLSSSRKVGPA